MNNKLKAILFSLLIFPGAGHYALGRYLRDVFFMIPAGISLVIIMSHVIREANRLAEQLLMGNSIQMPDTSFSTGITFWVFILSWAGAAADAFYLGSLADKKSGK